MKQSRNLCEHFGQCFAAHELKGTVCVPHPNSPYEKIQDAHRPRDDHPHGAIGTLFPNAKDKIGLIPRLPDLPEIGRQVLPIAIGLKDISLRRLSKPTRRAFP